MNIRSVKCIIVAGALLLTAQQVAAQRLDSSAYQYSQHNFDYYSKKRNSYNTAGWYCLGSGAILTFVGGITAFGSAVNGALSGTHHNTDGATAVAITGELIALTSIPLFIIAHHNKKKAHVLFQRESVTINNTFIFKRSYNAVVFTIAF